MNDLSQLGLFCADAKRGPKKSIDNDIYSIALNIKFHRGQEQQVLDQELSGLSENVKELDGLAKVAIKKRGSDKPWWERKFLAIDVETTGLDPANNRIIELAVVPYNMPETVKPFSELFSVDERLSPEIIQITGITDDMLKDKPKFGDKAKACLDLLEEADFLLAYNAKFDRPFLESEMARYSHVIPELPWVDPFIFICEIDRFKRGKKLTDSAKRWGVELENAHRATDDAKAAGDLMLKMAEATECVSLIDLMEKQKILQWQNAHKMALLKRSNAWSVNR